MKSKIKNNITGINARVDVNIYVPLFFILLLIAFIDSFQSFFIYFKGHQSFINYLRILSIKTIYCIHFLVLTFVVQWISRKIILSKKTLIKWSAVHLIALIFLMLIHQAIYLGLNYIIWNGRINNTLADLIFNNPVAWLDVLVYVLVVVGFYLLEYRRINHENEIALSRLEVKYLKSKLNELRNKIHPQFLFNTMDTISELVKKGKYKEANRILSLLSDFLRTTVYGNEKEVTTLEEEFEFVNEYLEIEKIRFNNNFKIIKNIGYGLTSAIIPNFILQPVVEEMLNRVKDFSNSGYLINISAYQEDEMLIIKVGDNYNISLAQSVQASEEGYILNITKERLLQLYGDKHKLELIERLSGGIEFVMKIPLNEMMNESGANLYTEIIY